MMMPKKGRTKQTGIQGRIAINRIIARADT
jgi:hypothetical protein